MNDQSFLIWIHQRLVNTHGENPMADYMHRLRHIIYWHGSVAWSPTVPAFNSIEELIDRMVKERESQEKANES